MPDKNRTHASYLARCPFYHREGSYEIQCDGWTRRQTLTVTFADKGAAAEHRRRYCRTGENEGKGDAGFAACPLFAFIREHLEEEKGQA